MSYSIGVTGTQEGMTLDQKIAVVARFTRVAAAFRVVEFHHGVCVGADEQFFWFAKAFGFYTVAHPPINTYKMSDVISDLSHTPRDFLVRNRDIVDSSYEMIATPKGMEEELRSGTWSTIRYAQKQKKHLRIIRPDGSTRLYWYGVENTMVDEVL